jgi:hypothetical protein
MALATVATNNASAGLYPIYPPGATVSLNPGNFLQSVPEANYPMNTDPNDPRDTSVIGGVIDRHPGADLFAPDSYFIGLFAGTLRTDLPNGNLYLWQTSGPGGFSPVPDTGSAGPLIQLGHWDGSFVPLPGNSVAARYFDTGEDVFASNGEHRLISSITPLSAFDIGNADAIGGINAVLISHNPGPGFVENRTVAVASNAVVPEPSTLVLAGLGGIGLAGYARRWRKR